MEIALKLDYISEYRSKRVADYRKMMESPYIRTFQMLEKMERHEIQRIYIGNDFCENRLQSIEELQAWCRLCIEENLALTVIFPIVSQRGMSHTLNVIRFLKEINGIARLEVVINDVGMLKMFRDSKIKICCGRLFDKSPCDMRFMGDDYGRYFSESGWKLMQTSAVCSKNMQKILKEYDVGRLEFDSGKWLDLNEQYEYTLYMPYSYITTGRMCMFKNYQNKMIFDNSYANCSFACKSITQIMEKKNCYMDAKGVIQKNTTVCLRKGNTIFAEHQITIDQIPKQVNRILIEFL